MNSPERALPDGNARSGPDEDRERNAVAQSQSVAGSPETDDEARHRRKLMMWGAVAVAGVLLTLGEGLMGYFREEPVCTSRIVFRLLGMAGWLLVLYGFVKVIWNDRKRK